MEPAIRAFMAVALRVLGQRVVEHGCIHYVGRGRVPLPGDAERHDHRCPACGRLWTRARSASVPRRRAPAAGTARRTRARPAGRSSTRLTAVRLW